MRKVNLIKICSIAGFFLAEIYMVLVVLAPNIPGGESRMIIPKILIPKEEGVALGAEPPMQVKITRLAVGAVFFGPFGALAGLGVGLLLEGLRQTIQGSSKKPEAPPPPKD
jgi:hypothetical protein